MQVAFPIFLKTLFWDTRIEEIDANRDKWFIIERIINYGDLEALDWMFSNFSFAEISDNLQSNYNISHTAIKLWAGVFNLNPTTCKCTQKPLALTVFN